MNIKAEILKIREVPSPAMHVKAFARVTLEGEILVNSVAIIENENGELSVNLPHIRYSKPKNNEQRSGQSVIDFISSSARREFDKAVLIAYSEKLAELQKSAEV